MTFVFLTLYIFMDENHDIQMELAKIFEEVNLYAREASTRPELGAGFLYQVAERLKDLQGVIEREVKTEVSKAEGLLSPRELEVISLAAKGQPTKEIAYLLDISMRTVQFHMSSIFKKLEVSSRTEAVAKALQLKIIQ